MPATSPSQRCSSAAGGTGEAPVLEEGDMAPTHLTRRALLGAGTVAAAGVAAACGASQPGGAGPAPSSEPVTLEFLHRWEGARTAVIDQVVADYQRLKPNVKVNSQLVFG